MACSVPPSATLPARTLERRAKPLASSTRPSVSGGQSWRFSLEWPRRASGCRSAAPSQHVLVRSCRVTVGCRSYRSVALQAVAGALQGVPAHGLAVAAERLAQALRWRSQCHAARSEAGAAMRLTRLPRTAALRTGQAQLLEQGRRTELPHGPQGDALDADRARADQLQGVDVDSQQIGRRVVGAVGRGRRAHGGDAGLHQLGGAALGLVLDRGAAGPELEGPLGGEDALDAGSQRRPAPARQGDVAAEVEQGALAHPGAAADGADEAVGEVGLLAPGAGTGWGGGGPADEQAPMGAGPGTGVRELQVIRALHLGFPEAGH